MFLHNSTDVFKQIISRYSQQINKTPKPELNVQKILDERNKELIDQKDEEDILLDELKTRVKMNIGCDDKAIRSRLKGNVNPFEVKKKRFKKKNLLNSIDENEIESPNLLQINFSNTNLSSKYVSPKHPSRKQILPPIIKSGNKKENVKLLKEIIEKDPKTKKSLIKAFNHKLKIESNVSPTLSKQFLDSSFFQHFQTYCSTKDSYDNRRSFYLPVLPEKNIQNLDKILTKIAEKDDTTRILKVIDKQTRLKEYVGNIEKLENTFALTKQKSAEVLSHYQKKSVHLKDKFKKVYEKNFA